jgi:hypothetical protein
LSAYMFFSQDWRERIKNENPDAGFGEIGKLLGAKWKELDDEERKVPYFFTLPGPFCLTYILMDSHT